MGYLQLPAPDTPEWLGVPVPTVMLLGRRRCSGCCSPWCAGCWCRSTARRRARSADQRLRHAIGEVSDELVVQPVEAELAAYAEVRAGLAKALA